MSQVRQFESRFEFYSTVEHETALERLAATSAQTKSSIHRLALDRFLKEVGALPVQPQPARPNNGTV